MMENSKYWNWIFILLLNVSFSYSQISFRASTSAKEVVSGAIFNVEFTLKNAKGTNFRPPVFRGFTVVSGPTTSNSTTIINGQRSSSLSYSYSIMAEDPGEYVIPSAIVRIRSNEYRTNMLQIKVVDAAPKKEGEIPTMFVKLEMDTNKFYVGQQIIVSIKLYTTVSIMNYDVRFDPDLNDMSKTVISTNRPQQLSEVYEGVQYATYVLRKMAYFPQRTGHYNIPKAFVSLGIKTGNSRRRSFFFNSPDKQINVNTESYPIDVIPLPGNAPSTFNGAIGHYSSRYRIDKTRLTTDDAISLILDIQGNGDMKINEAPKLIFDDGLEVYEPKLKLEKVVDQFNKIQFKKKYEYLITPTKKGSYSINPKFTYFDTDSLKYITKGIDTFNIEVTPGNRTGLKGSAINPNKPIELVDVLELTDLEKPIKLYYNSMWYWILFIIPWFALIAGWIVNKKRIKEENMDPLLKKKKYAMMLAQRHLKKALDVMNENDGSFYKAIQQGVLGYLSDKLDLQTTDLSKNNVQIILHRNKISSNLQTDTLELMNACEMALYGATISDNKQLLYEKATNLIMKFEAGLDEVESQEN